MPKWANEEERQRYYLIQKFARLRETIKQLNHDLILLAMAADEVEKTIDNKGEQNDTEN